MLNAKKIRAAIAVLLMVCLLFTLSGCGGKPTAENKGTTVGSTTSALNRGDEGFGDDDDDGDDDSVSVTKRVQNNASVAIGDNYEFEEGFDYSNVVDEKAKQEFVNKIPTNLKGQTVTIMTWWPTLPYEKAKMDKFTKNTGIKIKWLYVDSANYMQQLSALKMQGNAPDIACITAGQYPQAIMSDYFQPITNGKLNLNDSMYDKASMKQLAWNGKEYGVIVKGGSHVTMGLMMFNADMFKKYGVTDPYTLWKQGKWTWDTMVSTGKEIQQKSNVKAALTCEYHFFRLEQTCGEDAVMIKNGKLVNNLSSKNYRDAYKFACNLTEKGQYKIANAGLNRDGFMSGQAAMMVEESWALQTGERYEDCSFTIGYAPLPCKTNKTVVPSDAQLWGFPVGAKHLEAASYALEYWMNPKYDEADTQLWVNESAASFVNWLWEQPKVFKTCEGIINYGGDYKWADYQRDTLGAPSNVDSTMDRWSKIIDANIKKIYANNK